jgi:hypothetical protein
MLPLSQGGHLDEPLLGDQRFHHILAAVATPEANRVRLDISRKPFSFQFLDNGLAAVVPILTVEMDALFVDASVIVHDGDSIQVMSLGELKVGHVMWMG